MHAAEAELEMASHVAVKCSFGRDLFHSLDCISLTLDEPVGSLSLAQDVRSIRGPLAMQICSTVYLLLLLYSALEILCAEVSAG